MDHELDAGRRRAVTNFGRVRLVSQALSDAARRTGLSARNSRAYTGGGFKARRGAAAMRLAVILSFCLMVLLPTLAGAVYYGLIASNQYVSVAEFTVAGGQATHVEGAGPSSSPALAIIQDTQIIANYLQSRAALEKLQQKLDVKALYALPSADWLARFDASKPIEKFVAYWKKMTSVSIKVAAGAVEFKVSAFRPEDAVRIAQAALTISEDLINDMNARMNRDAVSTAEQELARTRARLARSQSALEQARNDRGVLDATKAVFALNKLITDTRSSLLQLQQQYMTQAHTLSESAPQVRALVSRIDTTKAQIAQLESKVTNTRLSATGEPTLADSMTTFAELDVENKVSERLYAGATAALEAARLTAERKMMYLNTLVKPVAPEEPDYPNRGFQIALILGGSLALWGICCGLALTVRNHMA